MFPLEGMVSEQATPRRKAGPRLGDCIPCSEHPMHHGWNHEVGPLQGPYERHHCDARKMVGPQGR